MRASLLRRWGVVGAVAVGGLVAAERAGWAAAAGVDVWNLPGLEREMAEQELADARLDAEYEAVAVRMATKDALTRDLVEGRSTLAETAARFRVLNADHPATMAVLRQVYGAGDPRELTARNVLDYVALHPFPSPAARAAAVRRAAAEFARLFPSAGGPPVQ